MNKKERKQTMTKENAINVELSEIVRECEIPYTNNFDDMIEIDKKFAIKTFKNGKIKFKYLNAKNTYFYGNIEKDSGGGYEIILDFHCKDLPFKGVDVIKNCQDFKIYFDHKGNFKNFYMTQLFNYFEGIIEQYDYSRNG
ncbi:hypothetical protein HTVC034P_gp01 [Pelagibacter phage HTVC034P]|nr:hypothetical protein HTVC034P_gp01 [Pelagibacter phage HTVC034P]